MLYEAESGDIRIAAAGDAMVSSPLRIFREERFLKLTEVLRRADASICNLEMPIHNEDLAPMLAEGSYGMAHPDTAHELKWMGFNMVSTASNHVFDFGPAGMLASQRKLAEAGVVHAGQARHEGLDDVERGGHGRDRIEGVAAGPEHRRARFRRQRMCAGHHAVNRADHRTLAGRGHRESSQDFVEEVSGSAVAEGARPNPATAERREREVYQRRPQPSSSSRFSSSVSHSSSISASSAWAADSRAFAASKALRSRVYRSASARVPCSRATSA